MGHQYTRGISPCLSSLIRWRAALAVPIPRHLSVQPTSGVCEWFTRHHTPELLDTHSSAYQTTRMSSFRASPWISILLRNSSFLFNCGEETDEFQTNQQCPTDRKDYLSSWKQTTGCNWLWTTFSWLILPANPVCSRLWNDVGTHWVFATACYPKQF